MYTPINHYQSTQVTTASPERILIMLSEGAVSFSLKAQERMNCGDIAGKGTFIGKALSIVLELRGTLNHEIGGNIAFNLERLYSYVIGELTNATIDNNAKSLGNAISILSNLRDTWIEAVEVVKKERSADNAQQGIRLAG